MPPKKGKKGDKGKGKGKGKKGEKEEGVEFTPEELLAKAKLRIEALERELVARAEAMNRAVAAQNELRQRVVDFHEDFEREKKDTLAITSDMTRQYKAMQEELLRRISVLENTIHEQKDQLEAAHQQNEDLRKAKDQVILLKDATIAELKQKMEDMAVEFGDMLRETLDKMTERIEATSSDWDNDPTGGGSKKLEEYNLGHVSQ
eukprot:CAMPEP_0114557548 /NCGR_PEP_ID=MMETSP0114-20121206/9890_1 /TAXON_ID=31324 /ORGANISM="Goniomonas sp, Strain m" /LENGTH=203 /DNA_ID=CAMNT_0001742845 /DNA_START=34 /DNA_END=645 /DNA_ORIENTATION=+